MSAGMHGFSKPMDGREFLADEAWLFVGVITLPLAGLASLAGIPLLAEAMIFIGWFLFTPVLLFWGEEVGTLLMGEADEAGPTQDPIEELKRRYAAGEIDEAELERRLETLHQVDRGGEDDRSRGTTGTGETRQERELEK